MVRGRAAPRRRPDSLAAAALSGVLALGVAACGGTSDGSVERSAAARSTWSPTRLPRRPTPRSLEPGFNATPDGEGVEFSNSFGASGDQSRAVEAGQPADVVHFSLEPDMTRLVDAGHGRRGLEPTTSTTASSRTRSSSFVVRPGNPENIQTWDDLITGDVEVLTPNPFTSGGARWNLMAAYGNKVLTEGASEEEGLAYVQSLLENVPVQDESARDALGTFLGGKGDVLLAYENEAIAAQDAGEDIEYVVPDSTILIETPIAVTDGGRRRRRRRSSTTSTPTRRSSSGPTRGYRPVDRVGARRRTRTSSRAPADLFTIDDLGGWETGHDRVLRSGERFGRGDRARTWGSRRSESRGRRNCARHRRGRAFKARPRRPRRSPAASWSAYLSLIVLIPLAAVVAKSFEDGLGSFWDAVTAPQAVAALKLTLIASAIVVAINAVFGTIIAWVLVRDEFPGKRIVNSLIDLPFALPTIVAGITLLALYGDNGVLGLSGVAFTRIGVVLALLFVTLPFVIRSVQPVLIELDQDMEEAAASLGAGPLTTFRRIILPNLRPAILSGIALAFARSIGEFGSLVLISGNIPFKTEVASVFIFSQIQSDREVTAAAVSVVLLAIALVILIAIGIVSRRSLRHAG